MAQERSGSTAEHCCQALALEREFRMAHREDAMVNRM
jgi:hypothetical protein